MSFLETRNAIRNFFAKEVGLVPEQEEKQLPVCIKTPDDFKVGEVYQMSVAQYSYVKHPYYVIIKEVGSNWIETEIPGEHSLVIKQHSFEWNFHIPRMKLIGSDDESRKLIYNQKNLMK